MKPVKNPFAHWLLPRVPRALADPATDPGVDCSVEPSLTDQSQAAASDVNHIMDRFFKTGVLPGTDTKALYGDYTNVPDYQESLNIVSRATQQFAALNAKARNRFNGDPAEFLAFVADPQNAQELIKLGLAKRTDIPPSPAAPEPTSPASGASPKAAASAKAPNV